MHVKCDVAIIGAGFGGSLAALVLNRIGLECVLVDRGRHPRYAIGESSTPVADLVLRDLTRKYDLPRLAPLAKHGTWRETYPELTCGLKRGFSYFKHEPSAAFAPRPDHSSELLVAASNDDYHADTHWFRPEVDAFLAEEAQAAGIVYFDQTKLTIREQSPAWRLEGVRDGRGLTIDAAFLVDASGEGAFLPRALGLASRSHLLKTQSWSVFGHFEDVRPWQEILESRGGRTQDHPFPCDWAALHQVLDEGWMWQLRFDNDLLSAGFVIDLDELPPEPQRTPQEEWDRLMDRYPSLLEQFAESRRTLPSDGLRKTVRLQRMCEAAAGENWALLPYTAGFIDALHSTGIAQTMCAIERLPAMLAEHWGRPLLAAKLREYEQTIFAEITLIDLLVHGCYLARRRFPVFAAFTMLYFAATTTYERRRIEGRLSPGAAFLCADDPAWRRTVESVHRRLRESRQEEDQTVNEFVQFVSDAIGPYNIAGLCDPAVHNMYRSTAAPKCEAV
jgi:FADH2 O2-dependent halogenase